MFLHLPQESELIESVEEEGKDDSLPCLASEEKPKIQVGVVSPVLMEIVQLIPTVTDWRGIGMDYSSPLHLATDIQIHWLRGKNSQNRVEIIW